MEIIKRNGDIVPFDKLKITSAIRKAMVECNVNPSNAESVAEDVIKKLHGEYIEIEDIQNEVDFCNGVLSVGVLISWASDFNSSSVISDLPNEDNCLISFCIFILDITMSPFLI